MNKKLFLIVSLIMLFILPMSMPTSVWAQYMHQPPSPPPTISSISPSDFEQGQTLELTISGKNFVNGAKVSFSPTTGVTITSTKFVNHTELRVAIAIADDAPVGSRDVTVTNPDGQTGTLTGGFTAKAAPLPPPVIAYIRPLDNEQGQSLELTIAGTDFQNGALVSFSPPTGITIPIDSVTDKPAVQFINPMELRVIMTIDNDAPVGPKDVTITNPDGQSHTLTSGFMVTAAPPPAITGLTAIDAYDEKVNLIWNLSVAEDFGYYAIYVSETEITDVTGLTPTVKIADIAVHMYQVTGLKDGIRYYFAVTAVDTAGNEDRKVTSVSATPSPVLGLPIGLVSAIVLASLAVIGGLVYLIRKWKYPQIMPTVDFVALARAADKAKQATEGLPWRARLEAVAKARTEELVRHGFSLERAELHRKWWLNYHIQIFGANGETQPLYHVDPVTDVLYTPEKLPEEPKPPEKPSEKPPEKPPEKPEEPKPPAKPPEKPERLEWPPKPPKVNWVEVERAINDERTLQAAARSGGALSAGNIADLEQQADAMRKELENQGWSKKDAEQAAETWKREQIKIHGVDGKQGPAGSINPQGYLK